MKGKKIPTSSFHTAGPYSPLVIAGDFVFLSGQLPLNLQTGELVTGDIAQAAEQCLENIKTILATAGVGLDKVVKTTIFLTRPEYFSTVSEVYGRYFPKNPPARSTVFVQALPKGALIEIEAIAYRHG
jgi:2-iminobutanoate/2-iminopropanoate deaminase